MTWTAGGTAISTAFVGSTALAGLYVGSEKVWPMGFDLGSAESIGGATLSADSPFPGGKSVLFDGVTSTKLANNPEFAFGTGDFTIECWVRVTRDYFAVNGIFQLSPGGYFAQTQGLAMQAEYTHKWNIYANGSFFSTPGLPLWKQGQWYHLALVRLNNVLTLYVDGLVHLTQPDTNNYQCTYLGLSGNYKENDNQFIGNISNFRIVKAAVYTAPFTKLTAVAPPVPNTVFEFP